MAHRVFKMTNKAWENGTDWDTAIHNGEIETVKEFDTIDEAIEFYENELGEDSDKYGVE